ncbi:hypothetical protein ACWDRB_62820 [Nonomuraea sp. NPDC003707]
MLGIGVSAAGTHRQASVAVTIDVTSLGLTAVAQALTLHDDDVYAKNTLAGQT